jgi:2-iminobutanoate/2-iminopropanoate deaminase
MRLPFLIWRRWYAAELVLNFLILGENVSMAEFLNPQGLPPPESGNYHHVARIPAGSELFFLAGQVGRRLDGTLAVGMQEQAECAFTNIKIILEGCGLTPAHLVKTQIFMIEREDRLAMNAARRKIWGDVKPPSTTLMVKSLSRPELLIEVDAIAAR